jgi:pectin methylesterase-like acyl-CoA thioesterase
MANTAPITHPGLSALTTDQIKAMLQPNTVIVWPGQATFTSIQAAINSITDATVDNQYQVFIGQGTYTEQVTLKPYVYLMGAGQTATVITYGGTSQENGGATSGVVIGASNSGLQNLTAYCTGGAEENTYSQALFCNAANPFYCGGVTLLADDSAGGENASNVIFAVANGYDSSALNQIKIGDSTLTANATGWNSGARAVNAMYSATYDIYSSQIVATRNTQSTNGQAWGATAGAQATLQLTECSVSGIDYSVNQTDGSSTAIDCVLTGPVGAGVQVINTAAASSSSSQQA